ncbi:hypothetical protein V5O48_015786 [Marasmius crinis-equi]|uniref:CxC5 like cysteine cluster associated with KDZ domain-containing protein n=1 Tax=Marasmius crinis-equi TaxID=585013 RepID=A0ABR3ETV8_9AGAR
MDQLVIKHLSQIDVSPVLSLVTIISFIKITRFLKQEIQVHSPNRSSADAPARLPAHIQEFLSFSLEMNIDNVQALWLSLKELVWIDVERPLDDKEKEMFEKFGKQHKDPNKHLGSTMYYPPSFSCVQCGRNLQKMSRIEVVLFSLHGACTTYSMSLRCPCCPIRYYPQYYVDKETSRRHYYSTDIPDIIQFEQHAYIEAHLCELMTMWMLFAWVSSQNCANIYNHGMNTNAWIASQFTLTSEQVWRAFVLNALLRHSYEFGTALSMSEAKGIDHDSRLKDAQIVRNEYMDRNGQIERLHACDTCEKFIPTDIPGAYKGLQHVALEDYRNLKGKSFFLLQRRLQRAGAQQPSNDSLGATSDDQDEEEMEYSDPAKKSDDGNVKVKARFGRRQTHNKQLIVCTCGVISARATMFGAEAISGVKDFMKSVYPNLKELPDVIFYDNNCSLQSHLLAQDDDFFENVILPVDVFHFKSKHSEADEFCQRHCNPAQWVELVGEDGKWVFNSSIAEQTNVWIGGYQAIVWDMLAHNYDFFLDEMIKRRNEILVAKLKCTGRFPYHVPPSYLL